MLTYYTEHPLYKLAGIADVPAKFKFFAQNARNKLARHFAYISDTAKNSKFWQNKVNPQYYKDLAYTHIPEIIAVGAGLGVGTYLGNNAYNSRLPDYNKTEPTIIEKQGALYEPNAYMYHQAINRQLTNEIRNKISRLNTNLIRSQKQLTTTPSSSISRLLSQTNSQAGTPDFLTSQIYQNDIPTVKALPGLGHRGFV